MAALSSPSVSELQEQIGAKDSEIAELRMRLDARRLEVERLRQRATGGSASLVPSRLQAGLDAAGALDSMASAATMEIRRDASQLLRWLAEHVEPGQPTIVDIGGADGSMTIGERTVQLGRMSTHPLPALGHRLSIPAELDAELIAALKVIRRGGAAAENIVQRLAADWEIVAIDITNAEGEAQPTIFLLNRATAQGIIVASWPAIDAPQPLDFDQHFRPESSPQELSVQVERSAEVLAQTFTVSIQRPHGVSLGAVVSGQNDGSLLVKDVLVPSALHEWNIASPQLMVLPGQRILEVNGVLGDAHAEAMHVLLNTESQLTLTVLRHVRFSSTPPERSQPAMPQAAAPPAPAPASRLLEGQHIVTFERPRTTGLDIGFHPVGAEDDCLVISEVGVAGLVHQWNLRNPGRQVLPGHRIVAVNTVSGRSSAKSMRMEIIMKRQLALTIVATAPGSTQQASMVSTASEADSSWLSASALSQDGGAEEVPTLKRTSLTSTSFTTAASCLSTSTSSEDGSEASEPTGAFSYELCGAEDAFAAKEQQHCSAPSMAAAVPDATSVVEAAMVE